MLEDSEGLPEEPEGLPKGPEGLPEGPEGLPEGPEGLPEGPEGLSGGRRACQEAGGGTDVRTDVHTDVRTDVRNFSPFYRTSSPVGAAAQKRGLAKQMHNNHRLPGPNGP